MTLPLGQQLGIRTMIYVAGEPVPFFWPMRAFIHHNPLHGLERHPFYDAVETGERLFHGRGYLPRRLYQRYLSQGKIDRNALAAEIAGFLGSREVPGLDLQRWLMTLLTEIPSSVCVPTALAGAADIRAAFDNRPPDPAVPISREVLASRLAGELLDDRPVYEAIDALYGTEIGDTLDELVVKSCLDFFDEGQSAWAMPQRERGFFAAWRDVAQRNARLFLRGLHIHQILSMDESPEGVIAYVMENLQIPRERWIGYFTRELARLHGWTGFIRWRSSAKHYHWTQRYPGDLVDYMAVRLTLALALLREVGERQIPCTAAAIEEAVHDRVEEIYLRHEFHGGGILPALAHRVEDALSRGSERHLTEVFSEYVEKKRACEAQQQAARLRNLALQVGQADAIGQLSVNDFAGLLDLLREFEKCEGPIWLKASEAQAIEQFLGGAHLQAPSQRTKRPFVQALFCIDTRSERIRRHLEGIGDYQTFGIAGFFGVPVSFMEMGKGSETHLCPVLLTPKNLVLEMTAGSPRDEDALTFLEKAMHELKESVLTPFVTVEAIGLLFGFDMVGKTVAPTSYNRWRQRIHSRKPPTRLLLDKLTREQADSIVRTVQRAVIVKALEQEIGMRPERITDELVRELREVALDHDEDSSKLLEVLDGDASRAQAFIDRLRGPYRINPSFAQLQLERLGRIGFSLDEQARFVAQALRAIGLTEGFSRFVLLVGHGSRSENNPYESALDCGACGGNHGLVSARVLAQMANNSGVRQRLGEMGIAIAPDAWFLPALHNTTTDEVKLFDLDLLPSSHLVYLDRLRGGLTAASRLCAQERVPSLAIEGDRVDNPAAAYRAAQRNAMDWSQVRPEWGLSGNAYFVIATRGLTQGMSLEGRAFLHSYDYRIDERRRLLETILSGPLVVGQWINLEHYFSTVDNERFGSGSKVYHNVAGRFGVMTGNLSDLRTGLPSQTVLDNGLPYHQPIRLITVIEAPFEHARSAIEAVAPVKNLVRNGWIRLMVVDPEAAAVFVYDEGDWRRRSLIDAAGTACLEESH